MAILERYIMKVNTGKWQEYVNASKIWGAAAERAGFPPPALYRYRSGGHPTHSDVVEYLWESFADMEEKYASIWQDLGPVEFGDKFDEAVEWYRIEYLWKLDAIE